MSQTITSKNKHYTLMLKKLHGRALLMITIIRQIVNLEGNFSWAAARKRVTMLVSDASSAEQFRREIVIQASELPDTLFFAVEAAVGLSCRDIFGPCDRSRDYMLALYQYLLQLCYERPVLLKEDDERGSHVVHIQEQLEVFIASQLCFNHVHIHGNVVNSNVGGGVGVKEKTTS